MTASAVRPSNDENGLLRRVPLLSCLDEQDISDLAVVLHRRRFEPREVIVQRGELGNSLYLVLFGRLKVVLLGRDGREVILTLLKAGDFFGEIALLDGGPRSGTVIGVERGELLELTREGFLRLLDREPRIAARLYRELCARLRRANEMIGDLALLDVCGRVAHILLDLAGAAEGRRGEIAVITPRPKLAEIAGRASTSEETVSRVLHRLHEMGAITLSRRALIIHHPEQLQRTGEL